MSDMGQTRRFAHGLAISALHRRADVLGLRLHVSRGAKSRSVRWFT
jgi:hypothetical protein